VPYVVAVKYILTPKLKKLKSFQLIIVTKLEKLEEFYARPVIWESDF
jgi:hypothetical protein